MWSGSLLVPLGGAYTFATSDDGSWMYVDGQPLLELGGRHPALTAMRSIQLERGVHAMSTPAEDLTVPPLENLTDRRGDEPQVVVAS